MNQTDLITNVAHRSGSSQAVVKEVLASIESVIADALARGEEIRLAGFMNIKPFTRAARAGRDPRSGVERPIPEKKTVKIRPGKRLEDAVSEN